MRIVCFHPTVRELRVETTKKEILCSRPRDGEKELHQHSISRPMPPTWIINLHISIYLFSAKEENLGSSHTLIHLDESRNENTSEQTSLTALLGTCSSMAFILDQMTEWRTQRKSNNNNVNIVDSLFAKTDEVSDYVPNERSQSLWCQILNTNC